MADINNVISWGLGSPSSIKYFITDGLSIGEAAVAESIELTLWPRSTSLTLYNRSTDLTLDDRSIALTLEDRA